MGKRLEALIKDHLGILREENLVTNRPPIVLKSKEGDWIEIFEWRSAAAIQKAHTNTKVQDLWKRFEEVCDYIPVGKVAESDQLFSEFEPMDTFG